MAKDCFVPRNDAERPRNEAERPRNDVERNIASLIDFRKSFKKIRNLYGSFIGVL